MKNILMFDYDGVIVDSLDIFRENLIHACQINNFSQISEKNFLSLFEGNMYEGIINLGIPKEKIPKILNDLKLGLISAQKGLHLFNGISQMLEELSRKNKIAIITSNVSEVVRKFLESKNIRCCLEIIGGEKESSKVLKIETIKTKYPNHKYFYIGDTMGDIIEGRNADAKTIAVTWGWHNESLLKKEHPDYIVRSPVELVELFNKLG